jgi:hypothetical protein
MGRGLPVFSVRLGQDPYGFIGRFQAFDGKNNTADVLAAELFVAYRKNKQTQGKMADSLVRLFEESHSFATAKERIGYLEELEFWESSFSERISAAVKKNSQISDSFGVPSRIRALGARWAKKGIGS